MMTPRSKWIAARALYGHELNGELAELRGPLKSIVEHLVTIPPEQREAHWRAFLCGRPDAEAFVKAIADVDPSGLMPGPTAERLTAHLGDIPDSDGDDGADYVWSHWIVRNHFTLLTSDPKLGKTRIGMALAKCLSSREEWPDGQAPTFPAGTKTLWVPGDRHQRELKALARAYGLPPEAVLLNTSPEDLHGGWDLDEPETVEGLRRRVEAERPGLVFIDTVWRSTRRKLYREDEVNRLMDPILTIAQECDTAIVGMMHASKDGETLGRRLEGLARCVIKLARPDPDGQPDRRKLWVDRASFLEPPPLGVTIGPDGCDFNHEPPREAESSGLAGRPSKERDEAKQFIRGVLAERDGRTGNELASQWEESGKGSGKTLWRAADEMERDGEIRTEGGRGTGKQKTLHVVAAAANDPDDLY
jgi:hypothetical protein